MRGWDREGITRTQFSFDNDDNTLEVSTVMENEDDEDAIIFSSPPCCCHSDLVSVFKKAEYLVFVNDLFDTLTVSIKV